MTKQLFFIGSLATAMLLASCSQEKKQETTEVITTETTVAENNDNVTQSYTDKDGKKIDLKFDNEADNVTINYNGETEILSSQKPASGIWYKGEHFEISGKGNDIQIMKDGKVVFEHQDEKSEVVAKNDKGDVLNMTFNNSDGTVKAYLNGGDQIDLKEEKAASGIWYKNDHYELSGKGEHYELKKDGAVVFQN